jgi:hypothetical protein
MTCQTIMTRREAYEAAHAALMEASRAFLQGMLSLAELNRACEAYEAAKRAFLARRVVH